MDCQWAICILESIYIDIVCIKHLSWSSHWWFNMAALYTLYSVHCKSEMDNQVRNSIDGDKVCLVLLLDGRTDGWTEWNGTERNGMEAIWYATIKTSNNNDDDAAIAAVVHHYSESESNREWLVVALFPAFVHIPTETFRQINYWAKPINKIANNNNNNNSSTHLSLVFVLNASAAHKLCKINIYITQLMWIASPNFELFYSSVLLRLNVCHIHFAMPTWWGWKTNTNTNPMICFEFILFVFLVDEIFIGILFELKGSIKIKFPSFFLNKKKRM